MQYLHIVYSSRPIISVNLICTVTFVTVDSFPLLCAKVQFLARIPT